MSSTLLALCVLVAPGLAAGIVFNRLRARRPKDEPGREDASVALPYVAMQHHHPGFGASFDAPSHGGMDGGSASP